MKRLYQAGLVLVFLAAIGVGTFSFGSGDAPCGNFEKLEIEGQTFDNFDDFMSEAEQKGAEYTEAELKENFEFEEREDGLYYKSSDCEVVENDE